MLRPAAFTALSLKEKTDALVSRGSFLHTRYEPAYTIDSYQLDSFYVEIYFHKGEQATPVLRAFHRGDAALPFFPEEKIHYLYQDIFCRHSA